MRTVMQVFVTYDNIFLTHKEAEAITDPKDFHQIKRRFIVIKDSLLHDFERNEWKYPNGLSVNDFHIYTTPPSKEDI